MSPLLSNNHARQFGRLLGLDKGKTAPFDGNFGRDCHFVNFNVLSALTVATKRSIQVVNFQNLLCNLDCV